MGEATVANFMSPHRDDRLLVRTADRERVEHLGTRSTCMYQLDAFIDFVRDRI